MKISKVRKCIPSFIYIIGIVFLLSYFFCFNTFLLGLAFIVVPFIYEFFRYILFYKGPLDIRTPDGSNQPYHPSVLFFEDGWNGFKYWMAYTPFPIGALPYRDRWEYPCICVSNDGIHWTQIDENPLDDLTDEQIRNKDYFSDTHLVYNDEKKRIECYYRLSEENCYHNSEKGVWLLRKYTYDGKKWSNREISIDGKEFGPNLDGLPCISPSLIKDKEYQMWYVTNKNQNFSIWYSSSIDGLRWSDGVKCQLNGNKINPWHIDCKYYNNNYYILAYDFSQRLSLWISDDGIVFNYIKTILESNHKIGSFYKLSLYRSCMVKDKNSYKVYFSAGNDRNVKIGLMMGENLESLIVCSSSHYLSFRDFFIDYYEEYFFLERWIIWRLKKFLKMRTKEWF